MSDELTTEPQLPAADAAQRRAPDPSNTPVEHLTTPLEGDDDIFERLAAIDTTGNQRATER